MKVLFMGTAAAEGIPSIFCSCDTCKRARNLGGRNIATRSQALIDESILLDLGPDTYMHFLNYNLSLGDITNLFITHSHCDHITVNEFDNRRYGMAYGVKDKKMRIHCSSFVKEQIYKQFEALTDINMSTLDDYYEFIVLEPYKSVIVDAYTVTPLPAKHGSAKEQCFIFLFEKDGRSFLYGNDTGIPDESLYVNLAAMNKKIDILALDCTKGDIEKNYYSHMSMNENKQMLNKLIEYGICTQDAVCYCNHFSHNCQMVYDELVVAAKKYQFEVTYDGLEIKI